MLRLEQARQCLSRSEYRKAIGLGSGQTVRKAAILRSALPCEHGIVLPHRSFVKSVGNCKFKYFAAQMTTYDDAVTFRTVLNHTGQVQCVRGASYLTSWC
jgi:hypothetical protein